MWLRAPRFHPFLELEAGAEPSADPAAPGVTFPAAGRPMASVPAAAAITNPAKMTIAATVTVATPRANVPLMQLKSPDGRNEIRVATTPESPQDVEVKVKTNDVAVKLVVPNALPAVNVPVKIAATVGPPKPKTVIMKPVGFLQSTVSD